MMTLMKANLPHVFPRHGKYNDCIKEKHMRRIVDDLNAVREYLETGRVAKASNLVQEILVYAQETHHWE